MPCFLLRSVPFGPLRWFWHNCSALTHRVAYQARAAEASRRLSRRKLVAIETSGPSLLVPVGVNLPVRSAAMTNNPGVDCWSGSSEMKTSTPTPASPSKSRTPTPCAGPFYSKPLPPTLGMHRRKRLILVV